MAKKNTYSRKPPKKRKRRRGKMRVARNIFMIIIILICLAIVGAMALLAVKYDITPKTIIQYQKEAVELVENSTADTFRPNKASVIYSSDGSEIAKLYEEEESTYLSFDDIPKDVINAFVSVEDRTFWENSGIDAKGIVRVLLTYIKSGGDTKHGASTITQQVARDIFLTNEKSLERKVKEIFIAQAMTKKYDKELIIEFYCNNCCFANATYGIEDASQTYLGKSASELSLSEAAYLCSIPNRPEYYDPFDDPAAAIERRDKILGDMEECGYISEAEMKAAIAEEIIVVPEESSKSEFHNYATTLAIQCATEYLMEYKYDFAFQYKFDSEEDYNTYQEDYQTAYDTAKRNLKTGGYQIYTSINLDAMEELQSVVDENLEWSSKKQENGVYDVQSGLTVINNSTGKIVAAIGGRSQEETANMYSFNYAFQSAQQPGSTMKPLLVYAPALEEGYNANSMLINVNQKEAKGKSAKEILKMEGDEMTLRYAVEWSKNGPVYWLASNIGISAGMHYLEEMEFAHLSPYDYTMSSALGGMYHGATTIEMANAYSTLVNHGTFRKADCLLSILNGSGEEIYAAPKSKQVYSTSSADQMVDILKGVLTRGTANKIQWSRSSNIEAVGKTGTTNDSRDGWFCGATPYYTIAVWVGTASNDSVDGLSGGNYPAQIWKDAMLAMTKDLPAAKFDLDVPNDLNYKNSSAEAVGHEEEEEEELLDPENPEGALPDGTASDENVPDDNAPDDTDPDSNLPDTNTAPEENQPSDDDEPATDPANPPSAPSEEDSPSIDGDIDDGTIDGTIIPQ